jgi:hypothetical protein
MPKRSRLAIVITGAVLLAAGISMFARRTMGASPSNSAESAAAKIINGTGDACCPAGGSSDPAAMLRLTLDPNRYQGPVRESYQIARDDPALLAQLFCYCGCDRESGHKNLLDCYRDEHGASCAICTGEARDGESMAKRGMSIGQIREALRARYSHGG